MFWAYFKTLHLAMMHQFLQYSHAAYFACIYIYLYLYTVAVGYSEAMDPL